MIRLGLLLFLLSGLMDSLLQHKDGSHPHPLLLLGVGSQSQCRLGGLENEFLLACAFLYIELFDVVEVARSAQRFLVLQISASQTLLR